MELELEIRINNWQYHSIHPSGFEEFSVGPFHIQNIAPGGPQPGESGSTDPEGLINQPYYNLIGGFLMVDLNADKKELTFKFYDEWGGWHYQNTKYAH